MGLSQYSLVQIDNKSDGTPGLRHFLNPKAEDKSMDATLSRVANAVTSMIERACKREFITRGELTEYHTLPEPCAILVPRQRPIISVASIYEDETGTRTYGADTLLTASTDYVAQLTDGTITRVDTSGRYPWAAGVWRAIKLTYRGGYATSWDLPAALTDIALNLCGKVWKMEQRKTWGISGESHSESGNWQRFEAAVLSRDVLEALVPFVNYAERTWETDA